MDSKLLFFMFYRILPFVLISFFALYSLLQQKIAGLILVIGAMMSSVFTIIISNMEVVKAMIIKYQKSKMGAPETDNAAHAAYRDAYCNMLTYNDEIISYLPLSTHTIAFIVGYMSLIAGDNALLITILVIFLLIDVGINFLHCTTYLIIIPLVIGGLCGYGWGMATGATDLLVTPQTCSANTTKKTFNCRRKALSN
jgi:hypothetical protein